MGKRAAQIAIEIPCGEATVYRARARAAQFLEEELPKYRDKKAETIYIHNAIGPGMWDLSFRAWKLYLLFIRAHQSFASTLDGKEVHEHLPGLKNRSQRAKVLAELNTFSVVPDELPGQNVKIFDFVS